MKDQYSKGKELYSKWKELYSERMDQKSHEINYNHNVHRNDSHNEWGFERTSQLE